MTTLIALSIEALMILGLFSWFLVERKRSGKKLQRLSDRQAISESQMNRFMEECELTLVELSETVRRKQRSQTTQTPESAWSSSPRLRLVDDEIPVQVSSQTTPGGPSISSPRQAMRDQVVELAASGCAAGEIAQQLSLPLGEIELMLNLAKATTA